jgi:hypothetical protein
MTKTNGIVGMTTARLFLTTALVLGTSTLALAQYERGGGQDDHGSRQNDRGGRQDDHGGGRDKDDHGAGMDKVLYIWAQDQAQVAPDFLAVIDFDEQSSKYGEVINVVPLPPPGNTGNEPHHCHLNSTKTVRDAGDCLAC